MRKIGASCHVTCEFSVYSCFLRCAALCYFIVCLDPLTLDLQRHWARLQDGVLLQASWSWAMLFWICRGLPCQLLRVIGPPFPPSSSAALHPERVLEGPSFSSDDTAATFQSVDLHMELFSCPSHFIVVVVGHVISVGGLSCGRGFVWTLCWRWRGPAGLVLSCCSQTLQLFSLVGTALPGVLWICCFCHSHL